MLRTIVLAGVLAATASLIPLVPTAEANPYTPRQYYSGWHKHSSYNYYYRTYYYKPSTDYVGYRHHYVVYYPSRPQHYYYYNPYAKTYWGRCPVKTDSKGEYSLLAEKDRKGNLDDIPEEAFPKSGKLPKLPEATDDATLDLPPDDLPPGSDTPADKAKDGK
jgi:hypothetical protein